jgi:pimeloyl-ACP methyl ester carboxylesterase
MNIDIKQNNRKRASLPSHCPCLAIAILSLAGCSSHPVASLGEAPSTQQTLDVDSVKCESGARCQESEALPASEFQVASGAASLWVRTVGGSSGCATLLAINGGPGWSHDYISLVERLATANVRVVTYDQRGTGRSTHPADNSFAMSDYVADVEAIRAALGVPALHLMGHSFGGLVAQFYVAAYPSQVSSLTLLDSIPPTGEAALAGVDRMNGHVAAMIANGILPNPIPAPVDDDCSDEMRALFPAYLANPKFPTPASFLATTCSVSTGELTTGGLEAGWDLTAALAAFKGPVHVVFGAEDAFGTQWRDATASAFTGTTPLVSTIPQAGHYTWYENEPDTAVRLLEFFVRSATVRF